MSRRDALPPRTPRRGTGGRRGPAGPRDEVGAVRKEWGGRLRVALVYPNLYRAGMSNLGFLSVHARINARPGALCERAFLPGAGEGPARVARSLAGRTLESGRRLADFDIVAFSLSYENDLAHAPRLLAAGGLSPFRADREETGGDRPLVLAGGFAASLNPEPSGALADAVVVGDGERAADAILDLGTPRPSDRGYLEDLAAIPGVYVPAGYVPRHAEPAPGDPPGTGDLLALPPGAGFPGRVVREIVDLADYPPRPVVLAGEAALGRMALVETSRGCPQRCGFCAAAHACPLFREVPLEFARRAADAAWPHRTKIGLIGAAVLDWRHFREFSREILARGGSVSPASVRADLVDGEIASILGRSGHRTVALAPECGREGLRGRFGKRLDDRVFFDAAGTLAGAGILSFKLYFVVGLPGTERDEEVEGAVAFVESFRRAAGAGGRARGRIGTVTAVLSPFVPKPFTPLQWAKMAAEEEIRARQEGIARALRRTPNVRVAAEPPRAAVLQAYLGLSDRRAEGVLRGASARAGADLSRGEAAALARRVVFREKGEGDFLPWDVVDAGLPRRVLRARYEAILGGRDGSPTRP